MKNYIFYSFLFFLSTIVCAAPNSQPKWYSSENGKTQLNVEVFLSTTCPHCQKAQIFFDNIASTNPQFKIKYHFINKDKEALEQFNRLLSAQGTYDFAVPSIYFCNSRWVGFDSPQTTGKELLRGLNYCLEQVQKEQILSGATVKVLQQWGNANKFNSGMHEKPSPINYLVTLAITDAVSPCAFFVLSVFLCLLIISPPGKILQTGGIFLFAVALMHYIQQVHGALFYQALPWFWIPAGLTGFAIFYFGSLYYQHRPIPKSAYTALAFACGLMIMSYQQTCAMNWSNIYQQWLLNQNYSALKNLMYQLLYHVIYLVPLVFLLIIFSILFRSEKRALWFSAWQNAAWALLIICGLILIVYPVFFTSKIVSTLLLTLFLFGGRFLNRT